MKIKVFWGIVILTTAYLIGNSNQTENPSTLNDGAKKAQQLSKGILNEIFSARQKPLLDSLDSSSISPETSQKFTEARNLLIADQENHLNKLTEFKRNHDAAVDLDTKNLHNFEALKDNAQVVKIGTNVEGKGDMISVRLNKEYELLVSKQGISSSPMDLQETANTFAKRLRDEMKKASKGVDNPLQNTQLNTILDERIKQQKTILDKSTATASNTNDLLVKQTEKLETMKNIQTEDYLNRIKGQVEKFKNPDNTIGVLLTPDNKLYVAGNVKTMELPYQSLADPELVKIVMSGETVPFSYVDHGLSSGEVSRAVNEVKFNHPELLPDKINNVYAVKPVMDPIVEDLIQNAHKAEQSKIRANTKQQQDDIFKQRKEGKLSVEEFVQKISSSKADMITETKNTKVRFENYMEALHHSESQLVSIEKKRVEGILQDKLKNGVPELEASIKNSASQQKSELLKDSNDGKVTTEDFGNKMGAINTEMEVQLSIVRDRTKGAADVLSELNFKVADAGESYIGASKPLCKRCEDYVKLQETIKVFQSVPGTEFDTISNWGTTPQVEITEVPLEDSSKRPGTSLDDGGASSSSSSATDSQRIKSGEGCSSGGRKKRSSGSSCIFKMKNNDPEKIREIDSDAFMKKYKDSGAEDRIRLSKIAEESGKVKLIGPPEDSGSVKKLVQHEKMKQHNKDMSSAVDSLKTGDFEATTKTGVKLSPKKTRFQMGKGLKKFTSNAGKVSGSLGKFLLAKGIVQGIASGDTTSLAIMGGRIGGEMALELGSKLGSKIATKVGAKAGTKLGIKATAKVASKGFKFLSKAAGPIGAIADIGLSAWSLSSAVKRLNNPNSTKWEQNEAIADIVGESLDIAITAVTTIASIAFPPLAPLFAVVGFFASLFVTAAVTLYKAQNHVDMLNSKIPLLSFEKDLEFGRYLIGKDTSAYITNLINTKFANNLAVNASISFLEQNPDAIGHVFPSRTMELEGGCYYELRNCDWAMGWWCNIWGETRRIASNCYKDAECLDKSGTQCVDKVVAHYKVVYVSQEHYKCVCHGEDRTSFGYPIQNQVVDFREKRNIYLDRAIPDPPYHYSYEELCRPGSFSSKGYRISQGSTSWEYLCEGAIAIRRRSRSGKYMLFDLEDGEDTVYTELEDTTANRFNVGNGKKKFYSGAGEDEFVMMGNCNDLGGILDGGEGEDTLAFGGNCNGRLDIDLAYGRVSNQGKSVEVNNFENVYGRERKGDNFKASCNTKLISGGGGSGIGDWDNVTAEHCEDYWGNKRLTIVVNSFTSVIAKDDSREMVILIPGNVENVEVFGRKQKATVLVQREAQYLTNAEVFGRDGDLSLYFQRRSVLQMRDEAASTVSILLEETDGNPTQVVVRGHSAKCIGKLEDNGGRRASRIGCPFTGNVFDLGGGNWNVKGGDKGDVFILNDKGFQGNIDGGPGQDEFHLGSALDSLEIVRISYFALINFPLNFKSVEKFFGREEKTDIFVADCTTSFISGKGGTTYNSPDTISIENGNEACKNLDLSVFLEGFTNFDGTNLQKDGGSLNFIISSEDNIFSKSFVETSLPKTLETSINSPFPIENLEVFELGGNSQLTLKLKGITQHGSSHEVHLDLHFPQNVNGTSAREENYEKYLPNLLLNFEEDYGQPSKLLVYNPQRLSTNKNEDNERFLAYHTITPAAGLSEAIRNGTRTIPNYFRIEKGSTKWNLFGGEKDDIFEFVDGISSGKIIGGGGANDLKIDVNHISNKNLKDPMLINLVSGKIKTGINSPKELLEVSQIQRLFGSENQKEMITVACDTQVISCGGPQISLSDSVNFFEDCSHRNKSIQQQIIVDGCGTVNILGKRHFILAQVTPHGSTNNLQFNFEATLEETSQKRVLLRMQPHQITGYHFSHSQNTPNYEVSFNFGNGSNQQVKLNLTNFISTENSHNLEGINVNYEYHQLFQSTLLINRNSGKPMVYSEVDSTLEVGGLVQGAWAMPNHFNLKKGQRIEVVGGMEEDHFVLHFGNFSGSVDGGKGVNTISTVLKAEENGNTFPIVINLEEGKIYGNGEGFVNVSKIQNVVGQENQQEIIYANCDTKVIRSGGSGKSPNEYWDKINIRESLNCDDGFNVVIFVKAAVQVDNFYREDNGVGGNGAIFTYVVESDKNFKINAFPSTEILKNIYRLQFGTEVVKLTYLHHDNAKDKHFLVLKFHTGLEMNVPLKKRSPTENKAAFPFVNPNVILETGNDRGDFHILPVEDRNGDDYRIVVTSLIRDASPKLIQGIAGAYNDFTVNLEGSLVGLRGSLKDDTFRLYSFNFIAEIDGAGGNRNHLELGRHLFQENESGIVTDLRKNHSAPSKALFSKNSDKIYVNKMANLQLISGRGESFNDTVFISCDTLFIDGFREIIVTEMNCPGQVVVIEVDILTKVSFLLPPNADDKEEGSFLPFDVFQNAIFHYKFNLIRSFTVETSLWLNIRQTKQIFHLAFPLGQLESICFSLEYGILSYSISGEEYSHEIDTFLHWNEDFFSSPRLETQDGFQIKINRHGEVFFTGILPTWTPEDDNQMAETYQQLAANLNATFIINEGRSGSFLYFGPSQTTNLLTSTDARSLLSGGGSNATMYVINDLIEDVKIYAGFQYSPNGSQVIHTVDLTNVIFPIRNRQENNTDFKYVPSIKEMEETGYLEIIMEGYLHLFPGKVILIEGAQYASKFLVILDTVAMTIEKDIESKHILRVKRSENNSKWQLVPKPLILSDDNPIAIMSLEDFELGQEIIYKKVELSLEEDEEDNFNETEILVTPFHLNNGNGSNVLITNLPSLSPEGRNILRSLVILDGDKIDNSTKMIAESITVIQEEILFGNDGDNSSEMEVVPASPLTLLEYLSDAQPDNVKNDWEDTLEKVEEELLQGLPEAPRKFKVPLIRKIWKWHRTLTLIGMTAFFLTILFLIRWIVRKSNLWKYFTSTWKYKWVLSKTKSKKAKNTENCLKLNKITNLKSDNSVELQKINILKEGAAGDKVVNLKLIKDISDEDSNFDYEDDACSISSNYDLFFMKNDKF